MKKLFFLFAVVALLGSCKEFEMPAPPKEAPEQPTNDNEVYEFIYTGWVNYGGPMACQVEKISQSYYDQFSDVAHFRLSWNACPIDPNTMSVKRLSIPHVHNRVTVYHYTGGAQYSFTGADQEYVYFKIISKKNEDLKMNIAIKDIANGNIWRWFYHIYPDDKVNNMYVIRL